MKEYTAIFDINTLYESNGRISYQAYEELSKIKYLVLMSVVSD